MATDLTVPRGTVVGDVDAWERATLGPPPFVPIEVPDPPDDWNALQAYFHEWGPAIRANTVGRALHEDMAKEALTQARLNRAGQEPDQYA